MSSVASKNLFELLGNDPEEEPQAPVEPVDKPNQRHGKRNEVKNDVSKEAPAAPSISSAPRGGGRGGRGRGRGDTTGSERAFQDRDAGRVNNRGKSIDDGARVDRHSDRLGGGRIQRGGSFDGRGARGGAGGTRARGGKDDRHSRSLHSDSAKQAEHGWGGETGTAEWNDEKAGQAQAWEEEKDGYDAFPDKPIDGEGNAPTTENGDAPQEAAEKQAEEEDKNISYTDYLAQQAEKKLALGGSLEARKANEGTKKQPQGKALEKDDAVDYFAGGGGKKQRDRERKEKSTLVLDHDYAPRGEQSSGRGGRGGRGRGRGEFRSERGERSDRGDRRGSGRGGPGAPRGSFRGGRGGSAPNVGDSSAFPTLGAA